MTTSVVIVGGGLIGLTTALLLNDRGAEVTIVERSELGSGASQGNAGFLCTTLVEPLASPQVLAAAFGALRDPMGPLRVNPRALRGMLGWSLHFARASTGSRYAHGRRALAALNTRHAEALDRLRALGADIEIGPELVVAFRNQAVAEHHLSTLAPMADFGVSVPTSPLDGDELRRMVPALSAAITSGYVLDDDHSIDPRRFVRSIIASLREQGVTIHEGLPIDTVEVHGSRVVALRTAGDIRIEGDEFVLAAGAGLRPLAAKFGVRTAVIPGQGYNVALPPTPTLTHPVIFEEAHAVATPFVDHVRIGGTMEFDGERPRFDHRRVDAVVDSLKGFLDLDLDDHREPWAGSRPMSPDGLPLLGRPRGYDNLIVAGGHGMFGLSLAPTTALALSELIVDGRSATELADFDPDRFSLRHLIPFPPRTKRPIRNH